MTSSKLSLPPSLPTPLSCLFFSRFVTIWWNIYGIHSFVSHPPPPVNNDSTGQDFLVASLIAEYCALIRPRKVIDAQLIFVERMRSVTLFNR